MSKRSMGVSFIAIGLMLLVSSYLAGVLTNQAALSASGLSLMAASVQAPAALSWVLLGTGVVFLIYIEIFDRRE